jgi:hypothetical protein
VQFVSHNDKKSGNNDLHGELQMLPGGGWNGPEHANSSDGMLFQGGGVTSLFAATIRGDDFN